MIGAKWPDIVIGGELLKLKINLPYAFVFLLSPCFSQDTKFSVHGYLNQAYGQSDRYQYYGIPEEGTIDLRNIALQFNLKYGLKNSLVIQMNSRRVGESPVGEFIDDVELDWGFYQYEHDETLSLKVGKVPLPLGIYNEIRDVGTVLPFYRIPTNVYGEGTWTSETVDGVVVSKSWMPGEWMLDLDLFYGGWDSVTSQSADSYTPVRNEDATGFQFWVTLPGERWRFGVHSHRRRPTEAFDETIGRDHQDISIGSVEGEYEHFLFRGEYVRATFEPEGSSWKAWYLHLGTSFSEKWALNFMRSRGRITLVVPFFATGSGDYDDDALGLNYSFTPRQVLKFEYHRTEGYSVEDLSPDFFFEPPVRLDYFLISFSASF